MKRLDGQWLCDHAIEFARWQHPAVVCRAIFNVPGTAYKLIEWLI